jgi:hypothetical protein
MCSHLAQTALILIFKSASLLPPQVPAILPQTVPGVRVAPSTAGQKKRRAKVDMPPEMIPYFPSDMTLQHPSVQMSHTY